MHLLGPAAMATCDICYDRARLETVRDDLRLQIIWPLFPAPPAYTSMRGDNGRLMSSEWSFIVSTLAEDDSSNGAHRSTHKQSDGPHSPAYVDVQPRGRK